MMTVTNVVSETCDHCKKREPDNGGYLLQIFQSTRTDRNIIIVHESCLLTLIAKMKRNMGKDDQPSLMVNQQTGKAEPYNDKTLLDE